MAAVAALDMAARGHRTLLVSTDPAHSTADVLQADLGDGLRRVAEGCWAMEVDPEREADRYIEAVKERVASAAPPRLLGEVYRQIDIARVSPGAVESALFDRFTHILENEREDYDRLVFDTAPTGQTLRLLSLPELMTTWIGGLIKRRRKVGALAQMWKNVAGSEATSALENDPLLGALEERRDRFQRARRILTDPARTAFVFVVNPRTSPDLGDGEGGRGPREARRSGGSDRREPAPPRSGTAARRRTRSSPSRRERQAGYLARISDTLGDWPVLRVDLQDSDPVGVDALRRIPVYEP